MRPSEGVEKPGGEELHPDAGRARAPGPRIPAGSHAPHGHPGTGAKAARNSAARVQLSPPGPRRKQGLKAWK